MLKTVGPPGRRDRRLSQGDRAQADAWARHGGASPTSRRCASSEADIAAMRAALEKPGISDEDRFHLEFALGKAMHDAGEADSAFAHYAAGNALRRSSQPVSRRGTDQPRRPQHRSSSPPRCSHARPGGCAARDPIFIVGMPRAGSTLVEQILASHTLVEGTSELPDIPALARRAGRYPAIGARADRTPSARGARRGISQAHGGPAADRPARSSSTNCPTTGCSCPSSN